MATNEGHRRPFFRERQILQGNAQMSPLHAHPQFSLANTSFGCALCQHTPIMTDAAEMTECALYATDAHVIAHNILHNGMEFVFCGTDYIDLVTYIYYSNWFSRNPSMSHILWQLLLADET